jgi:hypothetical protein
VSTGYITRYGAVLCLFLFRITPSHHLTFRQLHDIISRYQLTHTHTHTTAQARAIGDEAKLHDRLLDDLDTTVEVTTQALIAEAAHAEKIKETGKVCSMYICVAVEIIILFIFVMLIVVG